MRIDASRNPFPPANLPGYHQPPQGYRCRWIWHSQAVPGEMAVVAFRLPFSLQDAHHTSIHVSADQRYELYLDGERIGRGPMRGDLGHWQYESYALDLAPGDHLLAARVWWLPEDGAPMAQLYGDPGFLLLAEGPLTDRLSTGAAPWMVTRIESYSRAAAESQSFYQVVGWSFQLDGHDYPWGWESQSDPAGQWMPAIPGAEPIGDGFHWAADPETAHRRQPHHLMASPLPSMLDTERCVGTVRLAHAPRGARGPMQVDLASNDRTLSAEWQALLSDGTPLTVPPHTRLHVLIDLDDYYCGYPELCTAGGEGARVSIGLAEALYESDSPRDDSKGNRGEVDGKYIRCSYDSFVLEGGDDRLYSTLWWRAGRYADVLIETLAQPLTLQHLAWRETRYPLELESRFESGDAAFDAVRPLMFRTLQMCAHETYMDCPYYEQLQYVGDTRLEILATYVSTHDDRLPVRACTLFDQSRGADGLTRSRYPSRVPQVVPPFSLWWVAMVHDLHMWRRREDAVRSFMPGVYAVLAAFEQRIDANDLVRAPDGWNFVDWVPGWNAGWPADARLGYSAILNLQYVYALDRAIELWQHLGQPDLARHWLHVRERVASAIRRDYWVPDRGMFADDRARSRFSEHAQCLALLCDLVEGADRTRVLDGLLHAPHLARATVYFSHYYFEALQHVDALAEGDQRLSFWRGLPAMGLKTVLEQPEPSRSDCHAWGAHPLYHSFASFLGARPSEPGFRRIRIAPQPGPFQMLRGRMPHAGGGDIAFDLSFSERLRGSVTLPNDLDGELLWQGASVALAPGRNSIQLP